MTVEYLDPGGGVYCQWFNGSDLVSGNFPLKSLELIAMHPKPNRV